MKKKLLIGLLVVVLVALCFLPVIRVEQAKTLVGDFFTMGSRVYAAGTADRTADGTADDVDAQFLVNALPATGGRVYILTGVYSWTAATTVTRAINGVTISGTGVGTNITLAGGATSPFTAGGNNWVFEDMTIGVTQAVFLSAMGATTGWEWRNLTFSGSYVGYRTSGEVRVVDVVFADSGGFYTDTADNSEFSLYAWDKDGAAYSALLTAYGGVNSPYLLAPLGMSISNNQYYKTNDAGGVARSTLGAEGNNVYLTSSQGTLLVQNSVAQDITVWTSSAGSGRTLKLGATTATDTQANDSPSLSLAASYDADPTGGVTATDFPFRQYVAMITPGATPKASLINQLNGVSFYVPTNDNGAISHSFRTGAGVDTLHYSTGLFQFQESTTVSSTGTLTLGNFTTGIGTFTEVHGKTDADIEIIAKRTTAEQAFRIYTPKADNADSVRVLLTGTADVAKWNWTNTVQIFDANSLPNGDPGVSGQLYYTAADGLVRRSP